MKQITKSLAVVLASVTVLAGCQSSDPKTNVKNTMVEMACQVASPMSDMIENTDPSGDSTADLSAVEKELADMEIKANSILKSHGYDSQEAFEKAAKAYDNDILFQAEVMEAIIKECNFNIESAL